MLIIIKTTKITLNNKQQKKIIKKNIPIYLKRKNKKKIFNFNL